MKRLFFRVFLILLCLSLPLSLSACGAAPVSQEFSPEVTVNANAQRTEITLEGAVDLPDGAVLNIGVDGSSAARAAILTQYGKYTAMLNWCDNNGFSALEIPVQQVTVQDGKFYAAISMGDAPYQVYPISISLLPGEHQPEAVNNMLASATDLTKSVIGLHASAEAVYPNTEAINAATSAALEKAEAFVSPQLENLDKICAATAEVYTEMLQSDRKLKQLEPASETICTIKMDGDCLVMTLDDVYWDYYLHPDLEVYQPDDYRDTLAEVWMLPALQQCEGVVQILYGHNPCGKFLASDGRVIATATTDYEITFRETSVLDGVSSDSAE